MRDPTIPTPFRQLSAPESSSDRWGCRSSVDGLTLGPQGHGSDSDGTLAGTVPWRRRWTGVPPGGAASPAETRHAPLRLLRQRSRGWINAAASQQPEHGTMPLQSRAWVRVGYFASGASRSCPRTERRVLHRLMLGSRTGPRAGAPPPTAPVVAEGLTPRPGRTPESETAASGARRGSRRTGPAEVGIESLGEGDERGGEAPPDAPHGRSRRGRPRCSHQTAPARLPPNDIEILHSALHERFVEGEMVRTHVASFPCVSRTWRDTCARDTADGASRRGRPPALHDANLGQCDVSGRGCA